jgi:hypothetical protein
MGNKVRHESRYSGCHGVYPWTCLRCAFRIGLCVVTMTWRTGIALALLVLETHNDYVRFHGV